MSWSYVGVEENDLQISLAADAIFARVKPEISTLSIA
jgi:hypothetical protein